MVILNLLLFLYYIFTEPQRRFVKGMMYHLGELINNLSQFLCAEVDGVGRNVGSGN